MTQNTSNRLATMVAAISLTLCAVASAATSTGATSVFSFPNGFANAGNAINIALNARADGSAVSLTGLGTGHQAGGFWYTTEENIQSFTTDFTFQLGVSGTVPSIQGITFCIQNTNSTTNPYYYGDNTAGDANMAGYGAYALAGQYPLLNSVAVLFSETNANQDYPVNGTPNETGLYINGGPAAAFIPKIDLNPSGINMYSGHIMASHIVYDGSILTMTLRDTVTNTQFRISWPIDIPAATGSNSAWIGFTGGEIPSVQNTVLSWSFSEGYAPRLSTPTLSLAAGSYASAQSVSINGPAGATIYYTTNGQQPTSSSTKYTGAISVTSSEVIQAVAIESGYTDSFVGTANYQIAPANTPIINYPNGFAAASNLVTVNGVAQFSGSALQLTDSAAYWEAGSAWYVVPVNVQSFTTSFTLQLTNASANGMTFAIQNQPPASSDSSILYVSGGPNALAHSDVGLGYSGNLGFGSNNAGLLNSLAVIYDLYNGSGDLTGLYTNGTTPIGASIDMSSSGLNLHSGNPLNVTIAYNGSTLTMTITDSKTKASYSKSWTIDIPATVGGNTAYVGFTGATNGQTAVQRVTSWTYSTTTSSPTPAVPAAPTNLRVQ